MRGAGKPQPKPVTVSIPSNLTSVAHAHAHAGRTYPLNKKAPATRRLLAVSESTPKPAPVLMAGMTAGHGEDFAELLD